MTEDTLARTCMTTADAARNALAWFADPENEDLVGAVRPTLQREFRRFSNQAQTLADAVGRPMCVGLFGPSQAGKSYLAAGLSRPGSKPLRVRFAGEDDKNFLNQINPEGDRESTGVVTRFSLRDVPHPDGFPVVLRLLSEADLVKILGNSFFMDSDPKVLAAIDAEALSGILADARAKSGSGDGSFTVERVWDLQEYFQKQFGHLSPMSALSDYWQDAEELAPTLDVAGRATLFSPLWGAHAKLTETYETLVSALSRLGFAADAYAGVDALIPRAKSIIDVETLNGLGDPEAETLAVRTMQGSAVDLPRPVVTALIAELRLVITEEPWPMFRHTDLLDFPGARNRDPVDMAEFLHKEDALKQLLVRGKVAYLFDRYVADQELTSMLLCVKPSNQDITSLPGLVSEWIERTHGATPDERADRPILLFFILGWFNEHLKNKPGEDENDLGARYKSRMNASLTGFFGKSHKWPQDWANGRPFQNCFWLRDPGYSAETFASVDALETAVAEGEVDRIDRMRAAYLAVDEVQTHFADPADAWDKAMLPNDGGVSHLANSLEPVCEPDMKRRQVAGRLQDLRRQMASTLLTYYVSDDVEKRLTERRAVAEDVLESIVDAADARKFASLLNVLQIEEGHLKDHLYRHSRKPSDAAELSGEGDPPPKRERKFGWSKSSEPAAPAQPAPKARDKTEIVCEEMVNAWITRISERAASERIARDLCVPTNHLKELTAELAGAARRLDLGTQIANELRRFYFAEGPDRAIMRNAVIGARQISGFVSTLGYDRFAEAERPTAPDPHGAQQPVFQAQSFVSSQITLPEVPALPEERYLHDWGFAYMQLVDDNASSSKGQTINRKQNNALGEIIAVLETGIEDDT